MHLPGTISELYRKIGIQFAVVEAEYGLAETHSMAGKEWLTRQTGHVGWLLAAS